LGFRAIHATVTALLQAKDTWAYNIDRGKINAVVFLDLKKAFDTVDHEILLSKLSNYGIYGHAHQWFKSYLENRTQMCSINGSLSKSRSLSCGVPQRTILGPLLFLLYINDLPNSLSNCEPRMYADDTHLTYAGDNAVNIQWRQNQDLENVHNWLRANKLTLNVTKTEFMLIGSRQRLSTLTESPTFAINDLQVSQVTTAKSLGVTIDDRLDWSGHIEKVETLSKHLRRWPRGSWVETASSWREIRILSFRRSGGEQRCFAFVFSGPICLCSWILRA